MHFSTEKQYFWAQSVFLSFYWTNHVKMNILLSIETQYYQEKTIKVPADLFVYALVAAGLVFWLRSILGTRHGEERERPNYFGSDNAEMSSDLSRESEPMLGAEEQIMELAENPRSNYGVDNKTAENALIDIAKMDKEFDINFFLQGSQDAFALIVESFAEGDRDTLKPLLGEQVYAAFDQAIAQREKRKEQQMTEIQAISKAMITAARIEDKMVFITVKFTAQETSVTYDENGEIIAGNPNKTSEMHDIWTFGRNIRSKDPSWLVYETRADIQDDNDLIPDTH